MTNLPKKIKPKKGFMDVYKTYDPKKEGYGSAEQWNEAFNRRMTFKEAEGIIKGSSPYDILKLKKTATENEAKAAFRKLAKQWHPDKNPGKEEEVKSMMEKILAAYTIIKEKFKNHG